MNNKKLSIKKILFGILVFLACPLTVSASVTLNPQKLEPGMQQLLLRVAGEKDVPTTLIRVVVPDGVEITSIKTVPGWTIEKKMTPMISPSVVPENGGEITSHIAEVIWSGGRINNGEYEEFPIMIKVSDSAEELSWKVSQTYSNGEVVSWDGTNENYPTLMVEVVKPKVELKIDDQKNKINYDSWVGVTALLVSLIALVRTIQVGKAD